MTELVERMFMDYPIDLADVETVITAAFDPNQPRDAEGKWIDRRGGSMQIHEVMNVMRSANVGDVVAETDNGNERIRVSGKAVLGAVKYEKRDGDDWQTVSETNFYGAASDITSTGDKWKITGDTSPTTTTTPTPAVPATQPTPKPSKPPVKPAQPAQPAQPADVGDDFSKLGRAKAVAMQAKMGSWTAQQEAALGWYTSDGYQDVNPALQGSAKIPAQLAKRISILRSAMKPISQNIVVYRNTGHSNLGVSSVDELSTLTGKTVTAKGFSSTTVNRFKKFPGQVRIEIEVPKGTRGAFVGEVSVNPSEDELILDAETKYHVLSVEKDVGNFWQVKVRVVPS